MAIAFKVWDQGSSGDPMAIRVATVAELHKLAKLISGPDAGGNWASLDGYLTAASTATSPPIPFMRHVDVLWERDAPNVPSPYCQDRVLRVTYSGWVRRIRGFASQAYCYLDPGWAATLRPHHRKPVSVDAYSGVGRDLLVVRP